MYILKKVIYVSFVHLTDRISRDYYIDYLIGKGVTVEYWDVVSLAFQIKIKNDSGMLRPAYLHQLRTFKELEAMLLLPENRDAIYVMNVSCGGRFTGIFRLLSKYNCRMIYFAWGARPAVVKPKSWKIINHLCNPIRLAKILYDNAKVKAYRKFKLIKPFDTIFAAGSVMKANDQYAANMVPINLVDYDHFIRVRSEGKRIVKGRYAVYLDIYLPYHNDNRILGRATVNPVTYYQSLNRFFGLLEMEYGIKVIIAAHPSAEYSIETFEGREIYRLLTAELVKDADFVITDGSTSISYAVLNVKPIMLIYTNEMLSLFRKTTIRYLKSFSDYLEVPIYNVDEISQGSQIVIKSVNAKCYENYKYAFLTSPESEHTTTQEVLWREINI